MRKDRDLEGIHSIFEYREGRLFWKERPLEHFADRRSWSSWNTRYSGKEAGTPDGRGYVSINCKGQRFKRHQLIWIYFKGAIVLGKEIDHINGDTTDDRIENLRLTTKAQNQTNRGRNSNNTSGVKGLGYIRTKWCEYWCARFTFKGQKYIATFPYSEEGKLSAIDWLTRTKKEKQREFYCERP